MGKIVKLPEGLGTFELKHFMNSFNMKGHNLGATFVGILTPSEGEAQNIALPLRFKTYDRMRKGDVSVAVENYEKKFYTGLQVAKDPGVYFVYAGFLMIIVGCYITFFMSHRNLYVEVTGTGGNSTVIVTGSANKNKIGMEMLVRKISDKLREKR